MSSNREKHVTQNELDQMASTDNTTKPDDTESCSSECSISVDEEFYDAVSGEDKCRTENHLEDPKDDVSNSNLLTKPLTSQMVDSGIFSMHSSRVESSNTAENFQMKLEEVQNSCTVPASSVSSSEKYKCNVSQTDPSSSKTSEPTVLTNSENIPRPPPRTRKKRSFIRQPTEDIYSENNGNNSSSADSHSMTNSVESTTPSTSGTSNTGQNITSILDDIASIKGDLCIGEVDDKRSVYLDENLLNRQHNLKNSLFQKELVFSNEQLKEISKNFTSENKVIANNEASNAVKTEQVLDQVMVLNIDTGEKVPLCKAENILPKCLNPLSLHLMKLTNELEEKEEKSKSNSLEKDSSSLADTTFKTVTSLISSTLNDIKSDKKDKSSEKKLKKNLKTDKLEDDNQDTNQNVEEDEDEDEDRNSVDFKNGKFKAKIRDLKKLGSGLIRGVKGVKSSAGKERSTFHVDLKSYSGEPDPPPPPPRYKIKVNHKRGGADFDSLKLVQEINDCKGAIWCMKFSNCSQLLAAAGQDHLLRVYCAQKSWKYFTQLRNKASGQHISPNSTKERGSANGDSFGRVQRSSYSRSGSLNANDSHNNSSSSSSSSAFAKELYKDEDNTLSEEGPLLLFTIYRGHTADVLDLAWSKNHFLLSSSMDKTVRLWHITRIECLCTFRHIDFVTTIQFHPRDDRYFLSGSLDGKLRLWNIPDKRVTLWNEVNAMPSQRGSGSSTNTGETNMSPSHGLITASSFVQNGKFAVIGTYDGRVIFYTTDQLKYFTQIHVSAKNIPSSSSAPTQTGTSRRSRINKVTGIESVDDNNKILVTTNDSRLRLYDLRDLSLTCKYKGCINQSSQIKAAISHDHKHIICGSENNSFYIWRIQDSPTIGQRRDRNKQYECIRLLNPPSQTNMTTPIFSNDTSNNSFVNNSNSSSTADSKVAQGDNIVTQKDDSLSTEPVGTSLNKATAASSNTQQQQPQTSYSSAATKIVTSAIFAPVPGQIDEKARYVIATADFNGYIRIFNKY